MENQPIPIDDDEIFFRRIPGLNAGNRMTNEAEELKSRLAEIGQHLPVEGPFPKVGNMEVSTLDAFTLQLKNDVMPGFGWNRGERRRQDRWPKTRCLP